MSKPLPRWMPALAVVVVAAGAAGCGSSPHHSPTPSPSSSAARPAAPAATPGVPGPTPATAIICSEEARYEISSVLGATPATPLHPTWANSLYTCPYRYAAGAVLNLSVKELPDAAGETAYYTAVRRAAGPTAKTVGGLGDQAFEVADGSVYVRKDLTVLRVDVRALPAAFGTPTRTRRQVALTVATTIMSCWKEL